jgi:glycosyltransferase involved in cell wall biosynthesis
VTRIPQQPPEILPVRSDVVRPRWSVMIPVYNSAHFLKETLLSVLQQAPGADEMQIEVVDDCSTDADISALVQELGNGRVLYYKQPQNVGSVRNFATCLNRSTGMLVHLLHADDKVHPGFYTKMDELFRRFPQAGAACCNFEYINDDGEFAFKNERESDKDCILEDFLHTIGIRCPVQYVSMVVKREVYEKMGGFFGVNYGEDWEMWGRIATTYPLAYTPQVLANYRIHSSNISTGSFRTGQNFKDILWVIKTVNGYLPEADRKTIFRKALRNYARYAMGFTEYIWHVSRDKKTVYSQVAGALRMHVDGFVLLKAAKAYAKVWLHPIRKWTGNVKH